MKYFKAHQWGQCMQIIFKFTALVFLAVSGMAYAHPADALPDAHVRAYKEQLIEQIKEKKLIKSIPDISDEQVRIILKKTYDLRENIALLHTAFNGRISLTYVDETDIKQPILKIKMKNASHQDVGVVREIIKSNHFEITPSIYSGSEIAEIRSIISDGINKRPDLAGKIFDYSFDPIDEIFVIETIDGKREFVAKFLKSISMESIPYQVKKVTPSVDRQAKPIVSGGIPIRNGTGGPNCTFGFNVTGGGLPFVITAGHCYTGSTKFYQYSGTANSPVFFGSYSGHKNESGFATDYAIIGIDYWNSIQEANVLYPMYNSNTNSFYATNKVVRPIGGKYKIIGNDRPVVCRIGYNSGYRCGVVEAVDTVAWVQGGKNLNGMIRARICMTGGDSGGPVIYYQQAVGIAVASNPEPCGVPAFTVWTAIVPIDVILNKYHVNLL